MQRTRVIEFSVTNGMSIASYSYLPWSFTVHQWRGGRKIARATNQDRRKQNSLFYPVLCSWKIALMNSQWLWLPAEYQASLQSSIEDGDTEELLTVRVLEEWVLFKWWLLSAAQVRLWAIATTTKTMQS